MSTRLMFSIVAPLCAVIVCSTTDLVPKVNASELCIESGMALSSTGAARTMLLADIDSDGDYDMVVGNDEPQTALAVLLNDGEGQFGLPVTYQTVGITQAVAAVDVDADADLDLAVATTSRALVFLNQGGGAFAPGMQYASGNLQAVVGGDFDGDGDLDLALARDAPGTALLLWNDGSGSFPSSTGVLTSSQVWLTWSCSNLAAGDFDGDTDLDLVACNGGTSSFVHGLSLLVNDGAGNLSIGWEYDLYNPLGIAAGDLDADGDADLAVASSDGLSIFRNWNGSSFSPDAAPALTGNYAIRPLVLRDIDADGDSDIIAGHPYSGLGLFVVRNLGGFMFTDAYDYSVGPCPGIDCRDVDGDGDPDLAVAMGFNGILVIDNIGNGNFLSTVNLRVENVQHVATADLNQDGLRDMVSSNSTGALYVYRNLPASPGQFDVPDIYPDPGGGVGQIAVADFDGDGIPDVVRSGGGVEYFANFGDGTLTVPANPAADPFASALCYADFDSDGDNDLATASQYLGLRILHNDGTGLFALGFSRATNVVPAMLYAADIDRDGDQDLLATGSGEGMQTWLNDGGGAFDSTVYYPLASIRRLAIGDRDRDGDLDVVASDINGRRLRLLSNDGSGIYSADADVPLEFGPIGLGIADLNADGYLDLIAGGVGTGSMAGHLRILLNDGAGGVASATTLGTGLGVVAEVVTADLNNDYDYEILCGASRALAVATNCGVPACDCDCHGDATCDGIVVNVQDVVRVIALAFRGIPDEEDPNILCPVRPADVNCDGVIGVVDVVLIINVAFRSGSALTSFCSECP